MYVLNVNKDFLDTSIRDVKSKGRIVQKMHRPRDALSKKFRSETH
jgi:hypothetical protein